MNFNKPKIMGILNVTPDSFYDGGIFNSEKKVLDQVNTMIDEGVDIIDVGGYSSKPGAENISLDTELKRVIPYIRIIKKNFFSSTISQLDLIQKIHEFSALDIKHFYKAWSLQTLYDPKLLHK